jgi:hypothetical protein
MAEPVYYCWYCDAHRVAIKSPTRAPLCSKCNRELPENARLERAAQVPHGLAPRKAQGKISVPCFSIPG